MLQEIENVFHGANLVVEGNQQMAAATEEQSATIEEVAAQAESLSRLLRLARLSRTIQAGCCRKYNRGGENEFLTK